MCFQAIEISFFSFFFLYNSSKRKSIDLKCRLPLFQTLWQNEQKECLCAFIIIAIKFHSIFKSVFFASCQTISLILLLILANYLKRKWDKIKRNRWRDLHIVTWLLCCLILAFTLFQSICGSDKQIPYTLMCEAATIHISMPMWL